ncbi:MAG TPA: hypothetical protein PKN13_13060 [Accumulibacter sp.]|nr:hypothetical protein [Accumulibacter sp.]HNL77792.1 hypothetical protein [Accumulibacter sp.]HNM76247.1 hypothetical protein [Accumulibacter sp.]
MNILRLLLLGTCCFYAASATASCYVIYDSKGKRIYQSSQSPIDLSKSVSREMNSQFQNQHLVIITDQKGCADLRDRTGQQPANASNNRSSVMADVDHVLERSPLFSKRISFLEAEQ